MAVLPAVARAERVWVEGESAASADVARHPWWYDQVKKDQLAGGDFISNWSADKIGTLEYRVTVAVAGPHDLWLRANATQAAMSYQVNDGPWTKVDFTQTAGDAVNIAADGKIDLRFLTWVNAGKITTVVGANTLRIRFESENNHHGMLDCFVITDEPFIPRGALKPEQMAAADTARAAASKDWVAFNPAPETDAKPLLDLSTLNEPKAGAGGFIVARDGQFVHSTTGQPVRFWAVNGPPHDLDEAGVRSAARAISRRGVNLVRMHGGVFDAEGKPDLKAVALRQRDIAAMRDQGVYSHLSIFFPLWMTPKPDSTLLKGYDGKKHPFVVPYFNPEFQAAYREWWKALLLTPDATGKRLIDEPALFGVEIINEDSFFFWTFNEANIPDPQLQILEGMFHKWLIAKYGSADAVAARWGPEKLPRDKPAEGRYAFRPLWNIANNRTVRDQDTAAFLTETQTAFYRETQQFLRDLGFKGVICASNWTTADASVLGPLEKYSYSFNDFIDRHGYFASSIKGEFSAWSIRDGYSYIDRSALRFDGEDIGKPKQFVNPVIDIKYNNLPSMISETTFERPNRYRAEAPLYYSAYASLQGTNAFVHFAHDGGRWQVKPNFFMQPWTLMSPAMIGQFPATSVIFRQGLIAQGEQLVQINHSIDDLYALKGTPLPDGASFDELRLKDVPVGLEVKPGNVIDPLVHFAGRTGVRFTPAGKPAPANVLRDLTPFVDRQAQVVTSTTGQLRLDYGKGLLTINAPAVQGLNGALSAAGKTELPAITIESPLELGAIVAVALDGKPLAESARILLQVMSEEQATGFAAYGANGTRKTIESIGQDPWQIRRIEGTVTFSVPGAAGLKVQPLDGNGFAAGDATTGPAVPLLPGTLYYLVTR